MTRLRERLKERLDRRVARMSSREKIDREMAIFFVSALAGTMAAASVILAILGYLADLWWWWLAIPGGALCLAAAIALSRLAMYVGRDVLYTWDWW